MALSLQTGRPVRSPAEVVKLDYESNIVPAEATGVELSLDEGPSLVYRERDLPVLAFEEVGSEKKILSSSMISIGKERSKTATRNESGCENEVQGAEVKEIKTEVNKNEITVKSREVEPEKSKKANTENAKAVRTIKSKDLERKVKEEDIFDIFITT